MQSTPNQEPSKELLAISKLSSNKSGLCWPSTGTTVRKDESEQENKQRLEKLSHAVETILECIGEDKERGGLLATPMRYAKARNFLLY